MLYILLSQAILSDHYFILSYHPGSGATCSLSFASQAIIEIHASLTEFSRPCYN